jgi:two-component system response regulator MprA
LHSKGKPVTNLPTNNAYIAIVDDDAAIRTALGRALRMENYDVELFEDGSSALRAVQLRAPDAIVLDLQLPDIDGLEVCRRIRRAGDATPILMLTARDAVNDRVEGLDVGADDYLVKPFDLAELLARLRALLRRRQVADGDDTVLRFEDLTLNPGTREVRRGDRVIELTKIEFDLLELFLQHPRQVLTRDQILDLVWGYTFDSGTNSLAVYIGYLRRKLEESNEARLIQTVRGVGYALRIA